jgi:hypothetical protein
MTDIDLNDELEKLLGMLVPEVEPTIHLPADPCLRVVTQFMEGVDD